MHIDVSNKDKTKRFALVGVDGDLMGTIMGTVSNLDTKANCITFKNGVMLIDQGSNTWVEIGENPITKDKLIDLKKTLPELISLKPFETLIFNIVDNSHPLKKRRKERREKERRTLKTHKHTPNMEVKRNGSKNNGF